MGHTGEITWLATRSYPLVDSSGKANAEVIKFSDEVNRQ
jgi:hypothetical protein